MKEEHYILIGSFVLLTIALLLLNKSSRLSKKVVKEHKLMNKDKLAIARSWKHLETTFLNHKERKKSLDNTSRIVTEKSVMNAQIIIDRCYTLNEIGARIVTHPAYAKNLSTQEFEMLNQNIIVASIESIETLEEYHRALTGKYHRFENQMQTFKEN